MDAAPTAPAAAPAADPRLLRRVRWGTLATIFILVLLAAISFTLRMLIGDNLSWRDVYFGFTLLAILFPLFLVSFYLRTGHARNGIRLAYTFSAALMSFFTILMAISVLMSLHSGRTLWMQRDHLLLNFFLEYFAKVIPPGFLRVYAKKAYEVYWPGEGVEFSTRDTALITGLLLLVHFAPTLSRRFLL